MSDKKMEIKPYDFREAFDAMWECKAMRSYVRSRINRCQVRPSPSNKLIREYGLSLETDNIIVWAILERYFDEQDKLEQ